MEKILATEIRNGHLIAIGGRLWRVVRARHVHVGGRGGAYMQIEVKDVESGAKNNMRLRTDEKVERPFVEQRKMRYLYADGDGHVFMDEDNYEQVILRAELFDGRERYLREEMLISVNMHDGRAIGLDFPASVVFQVTHTEPQAKGATVSSSFKPATLENGGTAMVPSFINIGEKIRINTDSGEYMERAV